MASPAELAAMRRAIALSAAGMGSTSPNPPVGCVILAPGGRIAGEGYHQRKGEPHAEALALAAAGAGAAGGTAVVTLEPCNHHGVTPPCRAALISAGVSRVVISVTDPTSRGEGGTAALRAAGITVETGVLDGETLVVLGPWLTALERRRPEVTWPYLITARGIGPLPSETPEAGALLKNADAVLREDGTAAEAVPGAHGAGYLNLEVPAGAGAPEAASSLYGGGVRRLLLHGGPGLADGFLAAGIVDRVLAYAPEQDPSSRPATVLAWPELPPGFVITGAARTAGGLIRVEARPGESEQGR
jgi:diaminohydroxyphosphoribosylaminopyrimidine deaminase / 5-amino-6-(5-phosphoribosylamino)uracil reductase